MPLFPQGGGLYPDSIDNAILADMPDGTIKGRAVGSGTGNPVDLTGAQVATIVQGSNLSYRNILGRNGGFEVWQRGAGGAPASISCLANVGRYTADGWWFLSGDNLFTVGQDAGLTAGSRWHCYVVRTSGQTGTGGTYFEFPLDTDELAQIRGQIVTLSFTALCGAGFSSVGQILGAEVQVGTGSPVRFTTGGFTSQTTIISRNQTLTTTAQRFTITSTIPVPANATQGTVIFLYTPSGTAGATDFYRIDDVQLEIGSVATPFERRPFESELLACRRHYWKTFPYSVAPAVNSGAGGFVPITQWAPAPSFLIGTLPPYPVPMRVIPSLIYYNPSAANAQARNLNTGTDCSGTATHLSYDWISTVSFTFAPASVYGQVNMLHYTADAGI